MEILYQSNVFSTVRVTRDRQLLAESTYISTDFDASAQLLVDYASYRINEARWEICRSPGGQYNSYEEEPGLVGTEAYLGTGSSLRNGIGNKKSGLPLEMLSECVKAVIQSESFMLFDRGYPTFAAYERYWDEMYVDSCRYYSNLDRVAGDYIERELAYQRTLCLFNRVLDCRVSSRDSGGMSATSGFCDSAHELSLYLDLDETGVITFASGNYLRAPDVVCEESKALVSSLVGENIVGINKRALGSVLGGKYGCVHLVDLAFALSKAISNVIKKKGR